MGGGLPVWPPRALIAHHEAGHAAIGHQQHLTFSVIYIGEAGGQVIFDEQWEREDIVRDPALLDRYGLMLLAAGFAEQRYAGGVVGAGDDVAILGRMQVEARSRGVQPLAPDLWGRTDRQLDEVWPSIEALADELLQRSAPVANSSEILALYPHLGSDIRATSGERARQILGG